MKQSGLNKIEADYMVSVDKAVISKITKAGKKFEILVDPELALKVKGNQEVDLDDLLAIQSVFENSAKGEKHSSGDLGKAFGTTDLKKIVYKIIRDGEVQLTTEQRNRMVEEKTKQIANLISKMGINPQTKNPNPPERILNAMQQAKVKVELHKRAEEHVDEIVKKIQPIVPISFEKIKLSIKIPAQFSAKCSSIIRNFGSPKSENWNSDGSYSCLLELTASSQQDLFDKLNSITHGQAEIKRVEK